MAVAASGSAATRAAPAMRPSSSTACSDGSTSKSSSRAPSNPTSRTRLVASTPQPAVPGSSGRTCASSAASSSTTSTRRSASHARYSAARSPRSDGIAAPSTPSARRNRLKISPGSSGCRPAPRRLAYSWPSGNRDRSRWATCTARVVLPTPAFPATADTTTAGGVPLGAALASSSRTSATCSARPVKSTRSGGSWQSAPLAGRRAKAGGNPASSAR
jgi:hypothetical protein